MVTLPPLPTIPDTPPEPLTIETALFSLLGIKKIFQDQKGFYQEYRPIIISCPFKMLDNFGFEKDVYKFLAINKQGTLKKLKVIEKWAAWNMDFYDKHIRDKEFENPEPWEKYYTFCDDQLYGTGFSSVNGFPIAEEIVRHPDNKQTREYFTLFLFYDFCKDVHKFTNDFLPEPNEPEAQVNTELQPKDKDKPTTPQIALFFYYLAEGKHITRPVPADFRIRNIHKMKPYNFDCSGIKVNQIFAHPHKYMNKRNLSKVISMLANYPAGRGLAQNDFYSIQAE